MTRLKWIWILGTITTVFLFPGTHCFSSQDTVKIALNYPQTGPYAKEGKDQWYAAEIARKEINDAGGILGKKVIYRWYDSASNPNKTKANLSRAILQENVKMVFGGSSSAVAIAAGKICEEKNIPFFGTLTYSTATTGKEASRYSFRECYNGWMGAKALAAHMKRHLKMPSIFTLRPIIRGDGPRKPPFESSPEPKTRQTTRVSLRPFPRVITMRPCKRPKKPIRMF